MTNLLIGTGTLDNWGLIKKIFGSDISGIQLLGMDCRKINRWKQWKENGRRTYYKISELFL